MFVIVLFSITASFAVDENSTQMAADIQNEDIFLLGGWLGSSPSHSRKFHAENKSYATDNSVIVAQGRTYSVGYNTKLFNTNFEEDFQPLYGFADAWFYTLQENSLQQNILFYSHSFKIPRGFSFCDFLVLEPSITPSLLPVNVRQKRFIISICSADR